MILKLYRGHDRITIILIVLTGLLVWLKPLLHPVSPIFIYDEDPMPIYSLFRNLAGTSPFTGTLISFIIVMITGFYLVNFNTRIFFINERTLLPAAVFIILSGYFPGLQTFSPALISIFLIVLAVDRIIASYRKQGIAYNFFDAALLISTASLVYFNAIWFYIVVIAGIVLLRTVNFREIVLSITGLITPYVFVMAVYYLSGTDLHNLVNKVSNNFFGESPGYYWSAPVIIISLIYAILVIIAMVHLWSVFNTKKVRSRKTFAIFLWVMIVTIAVFVFVPSASLEIYYILLVPVTYFLTHYLVFRGNKKMANVVFAIIFISVLVMQFI